MSIRLNPRLEAIVHEKVGSGRYPDATAVVEEALRLLDERDRRDRLRAAVAVAEAEVERGDVVDWTPDFFERLKQEARQATRDGLPVPDDVKP